MLWIYFLLKFVLFFSIVKALVQFEAIQNHVVFLGILYTALVALISFVFVVSLESNAFQAAWLLRANRMTGLSPWLIWLAATLVLSVVYFKLLIKFEDGILFWVLLLLGIPVALF